MRDAFNDLRAHQLAVMAGMRSALDSVLLRFDPVYFGHFKCNVRRIVDYPNLREYTREIYQLPGVRETRTYAVMEEVKHTNHLHLHI